MKRITLLAVLIGSFLLSGCMTDGLSMREAGTFNYSNFVYGLYGKDNNPNVATPKVNRPIKLGVAQVGENAPPNKFMDKLRKETSLFSKVIPIPAQGEANNYNRNQKNDDENKEFEERMNKMRLLAKDLDVDYLFLLGGNSDYGSSQNLLAFFDCTIVGAFILPSNKITVEGKAAGALVSVETGKVIFLVNSEKKLQEHVPSFDLYGAKEHVLVKTRDALMEDLSDEFIKKLAVL